MRPKEFEELILAERRFVVLPKRWIVERTNRME